MKFVSIHLLNYIGIYNGMGLYEINIDFTRCRNRVVAIRGDNGSGKSTLMKALTVFPDSNDSFIPNMPSEKEIILADGQVIYAIKFIHAIKSNGDRDVTKAYISKGDGSIMTELNPNGNVSSYKDIVYNELGLDANFVALSQLSNDDRGLADKKPAERKKFVNSIISSLEVYNNIYKTLTKKSSSYKSMINAITAKLDLIGDPDILKKNLEIAENNINIIQDRKDNAIACMAQDQSKINILDPEGKIQNINRSLLSRISDLNSKINKLNVFITSIETANNINHNDYEEGQKIVINKKNSLIIENQIDRNNIQTLMKQKELEADELNQKIQKANSLNSDYNYDSLTKQIEWYKSEINTMKDTISSINVDISSFTKDEFIIALNSLKDLGSYIELFKSNTSYDIMQKMIKSYLYNKQNISIEDLSIYENQKKKIEDDILDCEMKYNSISSKMSLLNTLKLRPSDCTNYSCSFISEAKKFADTNPEKELERLHFHIDEQKKNLADIEKVIEDKKEINNSINYFNIILREVNRNSSLLSKMPNGDMFKDNKIFFENMMNGYSFEYMNSIYNYIDLANLFDVYKQYSSILNDLEAKSKEYKSKVDILDTINADIDRINKSLTDIANKLELLDSEILSKEKEIASLQELEVVYESLIQKKKERDDMIKELSEVQKEYDENNNKMKDINESISRIEDAKKRIIDCNNSMTPLMRERDKFNHSIQMMEEYNNEKSELEKNYNFIETLKYYSSPTTGIQLVFMELYMGKIISLANELLSLLFNGQFHIQPFVINESEFRIPCLGGGYLNDDISSMSSSQIGMISMILSFSLLYNSSTKYNIIKLDEIDGPLDYNNRTYFTDVLDKIMGIMGTEQCIIISHNSELQMDDFDIILLKHDIDNMDYNRGNIIWSY